MIYNRNVDFVKKYTYLGVTLDCELNLECFYKDIVKKVNNKIYNLRKLRKYLNFGISVQIYKQTILPLFDYGGFLSLSMINESKNDLQVMQNDILRICNNSRIADKISIGKLHKKARLLSLSQRWEKQLLSLMYHCSKHENVRKIGERVIRYNQKFVFKTETRIGSKYENSPFYKGTVLWNKLAKDTQFLGNIFMFKIEIGKLYRVYRG